VFRFHRTILAALALSLVPIVSIAADKSPAPPLHTFPDIKSDAIGDRLQTSMIGFPSTTHSTGEAVAFRKTFTLSAQPTTATLSLFADARYILWINGDYITRGPSRFQPNGPQYDLIPVASHLHAGPNTLAILTIGNLSGGKIMRHLPGLTARLEIDGHELLRTDPSWKCSTDTRYQKVTASWPNLTDALIDTRAEDGDWTQPAYDDTRWQPAASISGDAWGPLTRTLIPLLREIEVPLTFKNAATLPITLHPGEKLQFDTGRLVQAYPLIEFTADADTELSLEPFGVRYLARAGQQRYFTIDTRGLSEGALVLKSGRATITRFTLIERLYPYTLLGSFNSSDASLNKLWAMCARSCQLLSEDSYVDCADRERVEWMDDSPPGYEVTRIAMAGPSLDTDTKPVFSDPRLLAALLRRTALTLQPDGWVKAHTCSDRFDIHAKMEDRACDWIEGQRLYYDATGDTSILRQTWPAVVAQMNYFLDRRSPRGLVRARDWVVWGNPTGYQVGESATLNFFIQRALVDAAYLAHALNDSTAADRFTTAAADLYHAINTVLWNDADGSYYAGYYDDTDLPAARKNKLLQIDGHLAATTLQANLFALDRAVVPPERHNRLIAKLLQQQPGIDADPIMLDYYLAKQLYALDRPALDQQLLDLFRRRWAPMVAAPWQCSWEAFKGGSKAHIYGMYPGYLLSTYVLGVRRDAPVSDKTLILEPHLADLHSAEGTVVTEFGPVPISWQRTGQRVTFHCTLPDGITATLRFQPATIAAGIHLDGNPASASLVSNRLSLSLNSGAHEGDFTTP
jgi:alpha-L-rhamnosidase